MAYCSRYSVTRGTVSLHRYTTPDEAMSLASRCYEWPKKFADVLREAGTKAATEHRHFENALKTRRREFSERVDKYAADVTAVEGRSEIMRREQVVVEVSGIGNPGSILGLYLWVLWWALRDDLIHQQMGLRPHLG